MSICLSLCACLTLYLFVTSICLSVSVCLNLSVCVCLSVSVCLSVCLSPSIYPCVPPLSVSPSVCVCLSLSVALSQPPAGVGELSVNASGWGWRTFGQSSPARSPSIRLGSADYPMLALRSCDGLPLWLPWYPPFLASGPCAARRAVARWSWLAALGPRGCALSWNRCICRQVQRRIENQLGMGDS